MAKYDENTIYSEFRHNYNFNGSQDGCFIMLLDTYYDSVKTMPIEKIKSLLPTSEHNGPGGTYFEEYMIKKSIPSKHYPFKLTASIYDWFGDKSTSDVIKAVGNNEEEIYQRLLIGYLDYLIRSQIYAIKHDIECSNIENAIRVINKAIFENTYVE